MFGLGGKRYTLGKNGQLVEAGDSQSVVNPGRQGELESIDSGEADTYNTARDINNFANKTLRSVPKYQDYYSSAPKVQNLDADVTNRFRQEAYRSPGTQSAWLQMAGKNIGDQRTQALSGLNGAVQGQTQSAWNRMGATHGLSSGAQARTGYKAGIAGALGAQGIVNQGNQQNLAAQSQDELDRQKMLANAPDFENAANAGSTYMAGANLNNQTVKSQFAQNNLDTKQQIEQAQKLGLANLDQDTLKLFQQRGYKY